MRRCNEQATASGRGGGREFTCSQMIEEEENDRDLNRERMRLPDFFFTHTRLFRNTQNILLHTTFAFLQSFYKLLQIVSFISI